ncbi:ProQ/FINO family protein, partial [Spartinivicinus poritis]
MRDPDTNKTKVVVRKKRRVVVPNAETPQAKPDDSKREPLKLKQRLNKPKAILSTQVQKKLSIKPKAKPVAKVKPKRQKKKKEPVELPPPPKCSTKKALRILRERFPNAFNDELKPLKSAIANDVFKLVNDVMSQQKLRHAIRAYQRIPQHMLNEATADMPVLDKDGNIRDEVTQILAEQRMNRIKSRAERGKLNEQRVLELLDVVVSLPRETDGLITKGLCRNRLTTA